MKDTSGTTGATLLSPSSAVHYVAAVTQVCVIMSLTAVEPHHNLSSQERSVVVAQLCGATGAELEHKSCLDSAAEVCLWCRNTETASIKLLPAVCIATTFPNGRFGFTITSHCQVKSKFG